MSKCRLYYDYLYGTCTYSLYLYFWDDYSGVVLQYNCTGVLPVLRTEYDILKGDVGNTVYCSRSAPMADENEESESLFS